MQILQCDLTLLENTFFSSREISNFYQTEPVIGNYALCYALGLAASSYYNSGTIHYVEHLSALNDAGIYLTPATIIGKPQFRIETFNAQPDSYWFAMANNALVTKPDGWDAVPGSKWYLVNRQTGERRAVRTSNRPQIGTVKLLGIGNQARFYLTVQSDEPPKIPRYVRLGKWMSKARIETSRVSFETIDDAQETVALLLNPIDLAPSTQLQTFDVLNIHPVPLVRNAFMRGPMYKIAGESPAWLPANMRFGVDAMQKGAEKKEADE